MSISNDKIRQLLDNYFEGKTSLEEENQLRSYFRQEGVPRDLAPYAPLFRYVHEASQAQQQRVEENTDEVAGDGRREINLFARVDEAEAEAEAEERERVTLSFIRRNSGWLLRIAAAIILVLTGFSAGIIIGSGTDPDPNDQLLSLQNEIDQIKNALVYDAYRQTSASERIQAVRLTSGMDDAREQLVLVLIHTMNNDPNIHVRLSAIEALTNFADQQGVRGAFVQALAVQTDPFVQLSLIDILVELNEYSAMNEMQKLLARGDVEEVVKDRLMEGIAELRS